MRKNLLYMAFLSYCIQFLIIGCEQNSCFHRAGEDTYLEFELGEFNKLEVHACFDIVIIEDSVSYIRLEGGKNSLDFVETEVLEKVLYLKEKSSCNFIREYERIKIFLHATSLHSVDLHEVCKLSSQDSLSRLSEVSVKNKLTEVDLKLNRDNFWLYTNFNAAGVITIQGLIGTAYIRGFYLADYNFENLYMQHAYIFNGSHSDMFINARDSLFIRILDQGNIYYSGSPGIRIDSLGGTGQLLKWNNK